ncbi:MAG: HAMP domain-containing histidine kinase, partial [Paramuribaculum sp.]|nr:HAMP domain-containing histidine kinase [Paramuribaculum sp.]
GYNIYCLFGLYSTITRQTNEMIMNSLRDADLDEILNRPNLFPEPDSLPSYKGKALSQSRSIKGDTLRVTVLGENDSILEERFVLLPTGTNYSDIMVNEIGYGAHQTIDPIFPGNISDMDSLFRLSLSRKGIFPKVASVLQVSESGEVIAGDPSVRMDTELDSVSSCYNILTGDYYVAYYSSPLGYILRQMEGIIISTLAIIILITIALWYLFHTVSKLRTIEEMKDDFVSNMTHELKTPISIAYSANDALLNYEAANNPEKRETYLKIANKQLRRLSELVENILAMSMERRKTMQLHPEPVNLRYLMDEIAAAQLMRSEKEISIEVEGAEDIVLNADKTCLTNVINNLVDNSIKYSGEKVTIGIEFNADTISVADNGFGIPAKSVPYIFNKFYRVPHGNRQDVRGYGIGLYYVKSIVDKMGWKIDVISKEGVGTLFTIKFGGYEK